MRAILLKNYLRQLGLYILVAISLSACVSSGPKHIPYIVNDVTTRAQSLSQQTAFQLRPQLVMLAIRAYNQAQRAGYGNKAILSIIDYSRPSTVNRLWVIDLRTNTVIFYELVAHGVGSGDLYAEHFSDHINSKESSLGMYVTANNGYRGRHGYALRLEGLEPGFNDQAFKRAIVLHSAVYVSDEYIQSHGFLGQTWGCPAVNPRHIQPIINTLKGGTLIFVYANDPSWLKQSRFLRA